MLNSYKELIVWQRAVDLVEQIYVLTINFPKEETYGLGIQMRRAAVSIPSNIAEGQRRKDLPEYLQFLRIADASSAELETQIIISKRLYSQLDYLKVDGLLEEVQKMLNVLIRKLNNKQLTPKTQHLKPNQNAFTLIELLVAMSLFVIIVTIAVGSFISAMRTQRALVALMAVNDNASLAIEQMAREIRTGYDFCPGTTCGSDLSNATKLVFTNYKGEQTIYQLGTKTVSGDDNIGILQKGIQQITADNVNVQNLKFIVSGNQSNDNYPPRITIILKVAVPSKGAIGVGGVATNLQTTISARNLD